MEWKKKVYQLFHEDKQPDKEKEGIFCFNEFLIFNVFSRANSFMFYVYVESSRYLCWSCTSICVPHNTKQTRSSSLIAVVSHINRWMCVESNYETNVCIFDDIRADYYWLTRALRAFKRQARVNFILTVFVVDFCFEF